MCNSKKIKKSSSFDFFRHFLALKSQNSCIPCTCLNLVDSFWSLNLNKVDLFPALAKRILLTDEHISTIGSGEVKIF